MLCIKNKRRLNSVRFHKSLEMGLHWKTEKKNLETSLAKKSRIVAFLNDFLNHSLEVHPYLFQLLN